MAMIPRLWTISGLAVELAADRRTIAAALRGVTPDGKEGQHDAWRLITALTALGWAPGATALDGESYLDARTRWMRARAKTEEHNAAMAKLDHQQRERELIAKADVNTHWVAIAGMIKSGLLALPRSVANQIFRVKSAEEAELILRKAVTGLLHRFAAADPMPPRHRPLDGTPPVSGEPAQ
jgi:phage terminase Nu1 subunit (DNA packaging protein)